MKRSVVVLPTYNEAENIRAIVTEIRQVLPETRILIVDDHSPDGTGEIADVLASEHPDQVVVRHRQRKDGLGRAYLDGFARALDMDVDHIIQMDADFSHPTTVLPQLLDALDRFDFALGSRYIKGGGVENWGLKRRLLSRMGNIYARAVLGLRVQDATGGFKAFNRQVLEYLLRCEIESNGYNFQIEMTARALAAGFACTEIPITFTERLRGSSKMSGGIVWEALIKTYRLRHHIQKLPQQVPENTAPECDTATVPEN